MGRRNVNAVRSGRRDYDRHALLRDVFCPCGAGVSRADLSAARREFGTATAVCSACRRSGSVAYSGSAVEALAA